MIALNIKYVYSYKILVCRIKYTNGIHTCQDDALSDL